MRAVIANPRHYLTDGQFINVTVQAAQPTQKLLIPQAAVLVDQTGPYVLVVDAESKAQVRRLVVSTIQGADAVVEKGLEPGEKVITEGVQKVRPGAPVTVSEAAG